MITASQCMRIRNSMRILKDKEKKLLLHPFFESRMYKNQEHLNERYHDIATNAIAHNLPVCCSEKSCNKEIGIDFYTICHGFCIECFLDKNANHYDDNWQLKESKVIFKQIARHNNLLEQGA